MPSLRSVWHSALFTGQVYAALRITALSIRAVAGRLRRVERPPRPLARVRFALRRGGDDVAACRMSARRRSRT